MNNKELDSLLENLYKQKATKTILENGLTVLTKEDFSSELISVQVWVKTGSIHENHLLGSGLSHYLEHMLFKGTPNRDSKKITDDLNKVGANFNAYTTFDRTVYYINAPLEALEISLDVLSDILFNSIIDPIETNKEQSVILREIDMDLDDPDRQFSQTLFKTAFNTHPYRLPVIGERPLFLNLTQNDLYSYYKTRYVPNNMVLVVVGSSDTTTMLQLVEKYFATPPLKTLPPIYIPEESPQLASRTLYKNDNVEIVRGAIAFKIPNLAHEDAPGLNILAKLLGQGTSSFLWQRLREELNLVQHIDASIWNPGSTGLFMISYICNQDKRQLVEQTLSKELDNFYEKGFSSKEVQKALTQAIVSEINIRKTMSGQASQIGVAEAVIGDLNYPQVFIEKLKSVTPTQLKKLYKKYITPHTQTNVTLEPHAKIAIPPSTLIKKSIPDFEQITLSNGARLIFQNYSNVPKVNLRIGLLGSSLYEAPKIRGATAILASLLTKDTKQYSALEIAEAIENVGGSFSEFVGNNSFGLSIEVLPTHLKLASDTLKNALLTPDFKKHQFKIECEGQIAAIREELDDIASHGGRYLRELFFGDHPYRDDALGRIENLEALTLPKLIEHYQSLLVPSNMIISVAGDFDPKKMKDMLTPWIEKIPPSPPQSVDQFKFTSPPKPGDYQKFLDKEQVVVFEAYPSVAVTDPQYEVGELLDELFSGMSSNLFQKVREEQAMAYFIGSSRMTGTQAGMFYFYGGTNTENYPKVFQEIENEIVRIQKGNITDEEFSRSKTLLIASQRLSLQTPSSRASQALLDTLYGMDVNHWRTYADRINSITKKQLQEFALSHFQKSNRVRLAIGNIKS